MEFIEAITMGNVICNVVLMGLFFYMLYKINKIDFLTDPAQLVPKIMSAKVPIYAGAPPSMPPGMPNGPKGKNPLTG